MQCRALVLSGFGINCEDECKFVIEKTGGAAEIVHINELIEEPSIFEQYNFLVFPGGFAHGDDLGSGKVLANKMKYKLREPLSQFINSGKLVIGICNGFQVLVKMGLLPVPDFEQRITLTVNDSGKYEDRWVRLKINKQSPCVFTRGMEFLDVPVRHGEGKLIPKDDGELRFITDNNLHAVQYVNMKGELAGYPYNPNGSALNIAGICDKTGRVFGMMPHPEAFNSITNHPAWPFGIIKEAQGLRIFRNAVEYLQTQ
ncbi:TPA: phosphoribosylformylglycinamidine synthase subunit PurQ [Candidatus Micrarchaeota archaeon]|nr:phosphoribosylformylglycinamidine synthase subunit PurQ [Candidatus Micrarchaeota archaeon]